ncbi:PilZ domain-containing protein [Candidatus Nitrospira bockiana]
MELRRYPRLLVHFRIFLLSPDAPEDSGLVLNLSLGGCRIRTARPVLRGVHVVLRLEVPEEEPIRIERAVVRWSKGQEFGVQFYTITSRQQHRLKQLVHALEHVSAAEAAPGR